jgi:glycosyltransferase involved in cell wall biosynthesis
MTNPKEKPLRVVVDARLVTGAFGGVEQVILGLAWGLRQIEDGDSEYLFLTYRGMDGWLKPYMQGPCKTVEVEPPQMQATKSWLKRYPQAVRFWRWLRQFSSPSVERSDGIVEKLGVDLVHFTKQDGFLTSLPNIYHPHDLQHLHLPQFFTPAEIRRRELIYRQLCVNATAVAVASNWTKNDVMNAYGLPPEKVVVVPLAPPNQTYQSPTDATLAEVRIKFALPQQFVFYPAQTWPHKNHLGLIEALGLLKQQGLDIPLVCSGSQNEHYAIIQQKARELGLEKQVHFLGFVSSQELQSLYRLARAVVVASKFEAGSFPMWEAFLARVPAACSAITSLPEQVGDAALLFDPNSPDDMARVVRQLWENEALRSSLIEQGVRRVTLFSWERTARLFRAHYRRIAGRTLTSTEQELLLEPSPM